MNWLEKLFPAKVRTTNNQKKGVPEGLWKKCESCQAVLYQPELERALWVCSKCSYHHRWPARLRLQNFLDEGTYHEILNHIEPKDRLKFKDLKSYKDRLEQATESSGEKEALIVFQGNLKNSALVACAFEFAFMGGSMGAAVGERFVQAVEQAIKLRSPFICFSASGGARMQEGLFSLFQMAKTSAVLARLKQHQLPYISVLTNPTMGGVSASFAMLGDIILAEPKALIGFTGPRVIEQTVGQTLPEGFQRSEFLLQHGAIDKIVARSALRDYIARLLSKLMWYVG